MKKLFAFLALIGVLTLGASNAVVAQDEATTTEETTTEEATTDEEATTEETTTEEVATEDAATEEVVAEEGDEELELHQAVKKKFIEGGAVFMGFVLLCLILGLALSIERIIYLSLASTNTKKLLRNVENAIESGGIEAAKDVCRSTRGPVASIFYQGLDRYNPEDKDSVEIVEKSVISYGSVQMGLLEKGLTWISLFIAIAPMLGFMGTVLGMIDAFDSIQKAGDVSPQLVASGIKVALITTVSGLIVAIILQLFYNYIISKIDSIVNTMEDASITLIDLLVKHNQK